MRLVSFIFICIKGKSEYYVNKKEFIRDLQLMVENTTLLSSDGNNCWTGLFTYPTYHHSPSSDSPKCGTSEVGSLVLFCRQRN